MKVSFELWQLITLTIMAAGLFTGLGKLLLVQFQRDMDARLAAIAEDAKRWRQTERDLLQLKADLPERFVRREDYIRNQSVIEAKLDALGSKLELVRIGQWQRGNSDES